MTGADGVIRFQVYDMRTRLLGQKIASTSSDVAIAQVEDSPNLSIVMGWHDEEACYVDADGDVVSQTNQALRAGLFTIPERAESPAVEAAAVNAEAERRILSRYPLGKQITDARRGDPKDMHTYIDAVVDASNRLTAMRPIPQDFAADQHWPPTPA